MPEILDRIRHLTGLNQIFETKHDEEIKVRRAVDAGMPIQEVNSWDTQRTYIPKPSVVHRLTGGRLGKQRYQQEFINADAGQVEEWKAKHIKKRNKQAQRKAERAQRKAERAQHRGAGGGATRAQRREANKTAKQQAFIAAYNAGEPLPKGHIGNAGFRGKDRKALENYRRKRPWKR